MTLGCNPCNPCNPCSPCHSLTRCCSTQGLDCCSERCCCYMFGNNCCSSCCSCTRLNCCPSMTCCTPAPYCRPCRPKHIWDLRSFVPRVSREKCCPRSRAPPRKKKRDDEECPACMDEDDLRRDDETGEDCPACEQDDDEDPLSKKPRLGTETINISVATSCAPPQLTIEMQASSAKRGSKTKVGRQDSPTSSIKSAIKQKRKSPKQKRGQLQSILVHPMSSIGTSQTQTFGGSHQTYKVPLQQSFGSTQTTRSVEMCLPEPLGMSQKSPESFATQTQSFVIADMQTSFSPQSGQMGFTQGPFGQTPLNIQSDSKTNGVPSSYPSSETDSAFEHASPKRQTRVVSQIAESCTQTDSMKSDWRTSLPCHTPPSINTPPNQMTLHPSLPTPPTFVQTTFPRALNAPLSPIGFLSPSPLSPMAPFGLPFVCMPFPMPMGAKESGGCPFCGGKSCSDNCAKFLPMRMDLDSHKIYRAQQPKDSFADKPTSDKKPCDISPTTPTGRSVIPACQSLDETAKSCANTIFFIHRPPLLGWKEALPNKMFEPWLQCPHRRNIGSRESRNSRHQRDRGLAKDDTGSLYSWRNCSPSLRSISSQTSADIRKIPREIYRPPRQIMPRKFVKSAKKKLTEVQAKSTSSNEAASQTWPVKSEIETQTSTDEEPLKKFSPQNVFFVATPTMTDAWCRAVCGDVAADIPKILEKISKSREKEEAEKPVEEKKVNINDEKHSGHSCSAVSEENPVHPNEVPGVEYDNLEDFEFQDGEFYSSNKVMSPNMRKSFPKTSSQMAQNVVRKHTDMLRKAQSEMTKREKIASLLGRTDPYVVRARGGNCMKLSSSKVSVNGANNEVKMLGRPMKSTSVQRLYAGQQLSCDLPRKEKSQTNTIAGTSDVLMAGPVNPVDKGTSANLRSQAELQGKFTNSYSKVKNTQRGTSPMTASAARNAINKWARRLSSPSYNTNLANRRYLCANHHRSMSNQPVTITTPRNVKVSENKPSLNPALFGVEPNTIQRPDRRKVNSTSESTSGPVNDDWRQGMGAISVTRVSVAPRQKEENHEVELQNVDFNPFDSTTDPDSRTGNTFQDGEPTDQLTTSQEEQPYDVTEVAVPINNVMIDGGDAKSLCGRYEGQEIPTCESRAKQIDQQMNEQIDQQMAQQLDANDNTTLSRRASILHLRSFQPNDQKAPHQRLSASITNIARLPCVNEESISTVSNSQTCLPPAKKRREYDQSIGSQGTSAKTTSSQKQSHASQNRLPSLHPTRPTVRRMTLGLPNAIRRSSQNRRLSPIVSEENKSPPQTRPLESRVEIEDVGADEIEDYRQMNWNVGRSPHRYQSSTNLSTDKSRPNIKQASLPRLPSKHVIGAPMVPKMSRMNLCPPGARGTGGRSSWDSGYSQPPLQVAQSPPSTSPPSSPPPLPPVTIAREKTQSGEHRGARHEYYTAPANYGLNYPSNNVGTQAISPPYQPKAYTHLPCPPPTNQSDAQYVSTSAQQSSVQRSQYYSPPQYASHPCHPSSHPCDPQIPYERIKDLERSHRSSRDSRLSSNKSLYASDASPHKGWFHAEPTKRNTSLRSASKTAPDYGPEVPVETKRLDDDMVMNRIVRRREERSYGDAGEIVLTQQLGGSWNPPKRKSRNEERRTPKEKKRKEYYYDYHQENHHAPKSNRHTRRLSDRDMRGSKEQVDHVHRHAARRHKEDIVYEMEDYTAADSDREYHKRWKQSQLDVPKHVKSSRSHRGYGYTSSKRRVISTPGTPMTSSSCSPYYRRHYRGHSSRGQSRNSRVRDTRR